MSQMDRDLNQTLYIVSTLINCWKDWKNPIYTVDKLRGRSPNTENIEWIASEMLKEIAEEQKENQLKKNASTGPD